MLGHMLCTPTASGPLLNPLELVRLLAEPERRKVIAALILSSGNLDYLVSATGLETRSLVDATNRLTAAGLVEQSSDGEFVVIEHVFKQAARSNLTTDSIKEAASCKPTSNRERIIAQCIANGRLVHIPRKRAKRLVLLDFLAQQFEPGVRYTERQVNTVLRTYDDDVATLRRYLVDELFLDRADGEYWRSGGSVDL